MDEKTLGLYIRFWRLVVALRIEDWPEEELGFSREEAIKKLIAPFARDQLNITLSPDNPKFLHEVESNLSKRIAATPKTPPPNIPPNLQELVRIHQDYLVKEAEEQSKAAGLPTIEEQIEKTHQHIWQTEITKKVLLGRDRKVTISLVDDVDPAEPEIPEQEQIQERIYQVLKENNLLDDIGQPDAKILRGPSPEQTANITRAQEELSFLLQFEELKDAYSSHVYRALEDTPALLLYPDTHKRLAVHLGREYTQKVNECFQQAWAKALRDTAGDQTISQETAQKTAEALTVDLFQNQIYQRIAEDAVKKVFEPLKLSSGDQGFIVSQAIESLQNYSRRYLNPLTGEGRKSLKTLRPDLPKEVFLDLDPQGQPRLRVHPLAQPQNETVYHPAPTRQGLINQTIKALKGPFGSDAYYFQFQLESFLANPIGTTIYWAVIDPAIGALEVVVPGVKQIHEKYIQFQLKRGKFLRWYYLTPQLKYLAINKIKETLGVWTGLYQKTPIKPVLTPMAWLGKLSTAPFHKGASYFFFRGRRAKSPWAKRFWVGLGKAFRRREEDWDRNPLTLLIKLILDLTLGVAIRLAKKAALALGAKLGTKVMNTSWGQRLFTHSAIRGLRAGTRLVGEFTSSLLGTNAVSGGFLGFVIGGYFGYPMHGLALGWAGGTGYQFYLAVAQDEWLLRWLAEPSSKYNFLTRGLRFFLGRPAGWLATHPYARFPLRGLAFGYFLYLFGAPPWVIPLSMGVEWAWVTRKWWGAPLSSFFEGLPGFSKFAEFLGIFSRFFSFIGKLLGWVGPIITSIPLIWDLLHGIPLSLALQRWFGPEWLYSGQWTMGQILLLTRSWWWPLLKAGITGSWAWLTGTAAKAVGGFFSSLWASFATSFASLGILSILGIIIGVISWSFIIYILANAFFLGQRLETEPGAIHPDLDIEKTITPLGQNGQLAQPGEDIYFLDYTITYLYSPDEPGILDDIIVRDSFESPDPLLNLEFLFNLNQSVFTPCSPCVPIIEFGIAPTFFWFQNSGKTGCATIYCPSLGPVSQGETKTITMHLSLKDPPLSNYLKNDEVLCNTLTVSGVSQDGETITSQLPKICISGTGEVFTFIWPTSVHQCCSSGCNFGWRQLPSGCDYHEGIDIEAPKGSEVVASADGYICSQGYSSGYGCYTIIAHPKHPENLFTLYAHMFDDNGCDFEKSTGDKVDQDDKIGEVGNSGSVIPIPPGDGSHLHFAIGKSCNIGDFNANDQARVVNPCHYLQGGCPAACYTEATNCP